MSPRREGLPKNTAGCWKKRYLTQLVQGDLYMEERKSVTKSMLQMEKHVKMLLSVLRQKSDSPGNHSDILLLLSSPEKVFCIFLLKVFCISL